MAPKPKSKARRKPLYETDYFVFTTNYDDDNTGRLSTEPELPSGDDNWWLGQRLDIEPPTPLVYEIDEDDEGPLGPFYEELDAPLMSGPLVDALRSAGVDNLDTYDAVIRETRTGREHHGYKAVNIIGLVKAADESSNTKELGLGGKDGLIAAWFEDLVVSEEKARGMLFFRLAENVSTILIHKSVKEQIDAASIPGGETLSFIHPARWSG